MTDDAIEHLERTVAQDGERPGTGAPSFPPVDALATATLEG